MISYKCNDDPLFSALCYTGAFRTLNIIGSELKQEGPISVIIRALTVNILSHRFTAL